MKMQIKYVEELGETPTILPNYPNFVLVGVADLHSDFTMPLIKSRKLCKQEAKSKYVPHQGAKECARRRRAMEKTS